MKIWLTIEPTREEIDDLLTPEKEEGVSRTPLKNVIMQAYCLMTPGNEVQLRITTMTYKGGES